MFWPVNDSTDPHDHFGGSHWSLLAFSRRENYFGHYDSTMTSGGGNDNQARRLYDKLYPFVCPNYVYLCVLYYKIWSQDTETCFVKHSGMAMTMDCTFCVMQIFLLSLPPAPEGLLDLQLHPLKTSRL